MTTIPFYACVFFWRVSSTDRFVYVTQRFTNAHRACSFIPEEASCQELGQMKKYTLDAVDIRILSAVQEHGQLSKTKLAEIVNLSPTPCLARLGRLKAAGLIRGYRAEIALDRIAEFTQVVLTVALTHHRKSDFERFEAWVSAQNEITECIATGGGMDYVLKTVCPTMTAFQQMTDDMLAADLGIDRYMTYIVTRTIKSVPPNLALLQVGSSKRQ